MTSPIPLRERLAAATRHIGHRLRRIVDLDCRWCWKPIEEDYSR